MKKIYFLIVAFICAFMFVACDTSVGGEDQDEINGVEDNDDEFNFDYEPTTAGEYEVTFDVCQILNNGNIYNTGSDYIEVYLNGLEWIASFDLFAPLSSGENIYGTYTIVADTYDEWCGVPSSGGDDYGDTPSFFGTDFTEEGYYTIAYYVVSGSVVIAKDAVNIDVVTHYGSKIKASYKGDVVVETGDVSAVLECKASNKCARLRLVEKSLGDVVYLGVLRNRVRR